MKDTGTRVCMQLGDLSFPYLPRFPPAGGKEIHALLPRCVNKYLGPAGFQHDRKFYMARA